MKLKMVLTLLVVLGLLLTLAGCSGHAKEKTELEGQLAEMRVALEETQG